MKKKMMIFCIVFIVFAVVLYHFTPDKNLFAVMEIKAALEKEGYLVEIKEAEKDILQGERYRLELNNDEKFAITVYVYETVKKAEEDAATITPDGFGIERQGVVGIAASMQISWVDAPHFFLYENVIVQYVGMDFDLLQCLYRFCGNQIAGLPFIDSPLIERAVLPADVQYFPGNDVQEYSYPLHVEKSVDNC